MSSFSIRRSAKREAFSIVQDAVLEHPSLSLNARTVLAWMLGRPEGWEIQIAYMLDKLNMSENVWRTVKKDLVDHGFFSQTRIQAGGGKINWLQEATDEPLYLDKQDTKNHPLKTTHESPTHGKPQIKQDIYKQHNSTIPPTQPLLPISEESELDLSTSHQLNRVLTQRKSLLTQITSQHLADALEASLRHGEATGNKVRIPRKVLDHLKTLTSELLEEWGASVRVEREMKRDFDKKQLDIQYRFQLKPDPVARAKGEQLMHKLRSNRHPK